MLIFLLSNFYVQHFNSQLGARNKSGDYFKNTVNIDVHSLSFYINTYINKL